jgi:hypothetical protein
MALDASELLGSAQLAGVKVNPRGMSKRVSSNIAGANAGAAGAVVDAVRSGKAAQQMQAAAAGSETPKFARLAFLALTADELALIEVKSKIVTVYLADVIARVSRGEVDSISIAGGGLNSMPLVVTLKSGDTWALEVVKTSKKHAEQVISAFSG